MKSVDYEKLRELETRRFCQYNYKPSNDARYNQGAKDFSQHMDYIDDCKYYLLCNGYM